LIIINVTRASNHHIKMISEGFLKTGVMAAFDFSFAIAGIN